MLFNSNTFLLFFPLFCVTYALSSNSLRLSTATPGPWRSELLKNWNVWLRADALLTNLPPTLPDILFSGGGHLNANGQRVFSAALARELGPLLQDR